MLILCVEVGYFGSVLLGLSPEPGQNVGGEDSDSGARSDAGQSAFRTRFTVGKLITTDDYRDQTADLGHSSREEVLEVRESGVQRRTLSVSYDWQCEEYSEK